MANGGWGGAVRRGVWRVPALTWAAGPKLAGSAMLRAAAVGATALPGRVRSIVGACDEAFRLLVDIPAGAPAFVLVQVLPHRGLARFALVTPGRQRVADVQSDGVLAALVAPAGGRLALVAWGAGLLVEAAEVFALRPGALDVRSLMPRGKLAADAHWERYYGPSPGDDVRAQLCDAAYRALTAPCVVDWIDGLRLELTPGSATGRVVALSGQYEPELMVALARHLPAGGVFVDVGANVGMFTLFGAARVGPGGRVVAFEPSAREFALLERNAALNGLAQVDLHRAAVAEAAGRVTLRVADEAHSGHNTIGAAFAHAGTGVAALEEVPAVTLDAVLAGFERCDAIKLDLEGAELRALAGASATLLRLRPVLGIEVNGPSLAACGASAAELLGFLAAHGYAAHDIDAASGGLLAECAVEPQISKNIIALPVEAG